MSGHTPYPSIVDKDFPGKTAIVLGGLSGIGLEIARVLWEQGVKVCILGLTPTPKEIRSQGDEAVQSFITQSNNDILNSMPTFEGAYPRFQPEIYQCNVTQETPDGKGWELENVINHIGKKHGTVHMLADSIGVSPRPALADLKPADMTFVMAVNTNYLPAMFRAVTPWMENTNGGRVVLIGSTLPHGVSDPNALAYAMSKAARAAAVTFFARDLGPKNIAVSMISPSHVHTPNEVALHGNKAEEVNRTARAKRFIQHDLTAEDVARQAMLHLTSHAQNYTGIEMLMGAGDKQARPTMTTNLQMLFGAAADEVGLSQIALQLKQLRDSQETLQNMLFQLLTPHADGHASTARPVFNGKIHGAPLHLVPGGGSDGD
jgi:NAD(P)-dependent dehydrogenase (short-subunit alcohol dehydrogenase family)